MLATSIGITALGGIATAAVAGASDGFDPASLLANGVTPTAVVLLVVFGWLRPKWATAQLERSLQEARDDATQARSEHSALVNQLVNDIVPALTRSADATAAATAAVQELTRRALSGGG